MAKQTEVSPGLFTVDYNPKERRKRYRVTRDSFRSVLPRALQARRTEQRIAGDVVDKVSAAPVDHPLPRKKTAARS